MDLKTIFINSISPPRCACCNIRLPLESTAMFCYDCSKDFHLNKGTPCIICGKPINTNGDKICIYCKSTKIYYTKNISRYLYKGSVKTAVQNMKFKKRAWISHEIGRWLSETVKENYNDIMFDNIMYVPMSPFDELCRGFNQTYNMAEIISQCIKVPVLDNVLYKKAGVKTQSGLSRRERAENIKNAFVVKKNHLLTDKVILLVDDVFTTGSTVNECARVLKMNGASAVYVVTACVAVID